MIDFYLLDIGADLKGLPKLLTMALHKPYEYYGKPLLLAYVHQGKPEKFVIAPIGEC